MPPPEPRSNDRLPLPFLLRVIFSCNTSCLASVLFAVSISFWRMFIAAIILWLFSLVKPQGNINVKINVNVNAVVVLFFWGFSIAIFGLWAIYGQCLWIVGCCFGFLAVGFG